jgi:hypothetical protein
MRLFNYEDYYADNSQTVIQRMAEDERILNVVVGNINDKTDHGSREVFVIMQCTLLSSMLETMSNHNIPISSYMEVYNNDNG